jgi:hypothetical protein
MLVRSNGTWLLQTAFFVSLLWGLTSFAQCSGNVQGVVTDPTGAAVGNASVRLRNVSTIPTWGVLTHTWEMPRTERSPVR